MKNIEKKYGVFELDLKSRYESHGANKLLYLPNCDLHDTEEEAIRNIPLFRYGHYVIMPVYIHTEYVSEESLFLERKLQVLEKWGKMLKDKEERDKL